MQLRKLLYLFTAFCFMVGGLFLIPQTAMAKGHPVFGSNWMPPGHAKKAQPIEAVTEVEEVDLEERAEGETVEANEDDPEETQNEGSYVKQKGPAWAREQHPSVKGLMNAYRNLCRNGAPEWQRAQFRAKIEARGGIVEDIDEIEEKEYTITVDGDSSIELMFDQSKDITFLVEDNEAEAAELPEGYEIEIQVSDDDSVLTSPEDEDTVGMSDTEGVTEVVTVTADEENEGTATITVTLYNDEDETVDSETIEVTVGEAVATTGNLTSNDSDLTFTADENEGIAYATMAGERINFDYQIVDQKDDPIDVDEDTNIIWTVKNTGENDITVYGVEETGVTVGPDEEKDFTEEISDGDDSDTISIRAYDVTEAEITAQIEDNEDSLESTIILFYDEDNMPVSDSDVTIEGTVEAFATGEDNEDGTQLLIYDGDEYFHITATFETVLIENEDENIPDIGDEAELEEYLEYDMEVNVELDEYEEDDSSDEDIIKLYLN
ncbi:MAG: hypothetical protein FH756_18380 [Firmicutes bacterium]|nr:hypothetical protein [Bacillota bacterium]